MIARFMIVLNLSDGGKEMQESELRKIMEAMIETQDMSGEEKITMLARMTAIYMAGENAASFSMKLGEFRVEVSITED